MSNQWNLCVTFQRLAVIACTAIVFNAWSTDAAVAGQTIRVTTKVLGGEDPQDVSIKYKIYRSSLLTSRFFKRNTFTLKNGESRDKKYDMYGTHFNAYRIAWSMPDGYEMGDITCEDRKAGINIDRKNQRLTANLRWSSKKNEVVCKFTVQAFASLAIEVSGKVEPQVPQANDGGKISYEIEVKNTSPVQRLVDINVTDNKIGNLICRPGDHKSISSLEAGDTSICEGTYELTQDDINLGKVENVAKAVAADDRETSVFKVGTTEITQVLDLTLAASVDRQDFNAIGDEVNVTYKLTNSGNVTLNDVQIIGLDQRFNSNNCVKYDLDGLGKGSCVATYIVTQEDIAAGAIDIPSAKAQGEAASEGNPIISSNETDPLIIKGPPVDTAMAEETERFIHRRVDNLLSHGPDRARLLRRLQTSDRRGSQGGLKFSGNNQPNGSGPASSGGSVRPLSSARSPNSEVALSSAGGSGQSLSHSPAGGMSLGSAHTGNSTVAEDGVPWVNDAFTSSAREDAFGMAATGPTSTSTTLFSSLGSQLAPLLSSGSTSFKFGTSLSEVRAKAAEAEGRAQQKKLEAAGLSLSGASGLASLQVLRPGLDIWVDGQFSRYTDDLGGINREGDFGILYLGADYVLAPGVLVGALVQVDDTREDIKDPARTGKIEGTGWMVGPYFGAKLLDNLFFDARAAWGQSDNDIWLRDKAEGYRTGSFETDRWLATARLTGVLYSLIPDWRLSPELGLAYGHESYGTYTNSLNQTEPGASANIGRLTGGAELAYQIQMRNGTTIEPMVGITGIWNFDSTPLKIDGVLQQTDESRAKVEGGLQISTPSGLGLRAAGNYDGLGGGDFQSYGGSLWVNVPLN